MPGEEKETGLGPSNGEKLPPAVVTLSLLGGVANDRFFGLLPLRLLVLLCRLSVFCHLSFSRGLFLLTRCSNPLGVFYEHTHDREIHTFVVFEQKPRENQLDKGDWGRRTGTEAPQHGPGLYLLILFVLGGLFILLHLKNILTTA